MGALKVSVHALMAAKEPAQARCLSPACLTAQHQATVQKLLSATVLHNSPLIVTIDGLLSQDVAAELVALHDTERARLTSLRKRPRWCFLNDSTAASMLHPLRAAGRLSYADDELVRSGPSPYPCFEGAARHAELSALLSPSSALTLEEEELASAHKALLQLVQAKLEAVSGLSKHRYGHAKQLLAYQDPGAQYTAHRDCHDGSTDDRFASALIYLTDASGGATRFPLLNLTVTPKVGRALIWLNLDPRSAKARSCATCPATPRLSSMPPCLSSSQHLSAPIDHGAQREVVFQQWFMWGGPSRSPLPEWDTLCDGSGSCREYLLRR